MAYELAPEAVRATAAAGWGSRGPGGGPVDLDVHGIVGVRLLDATPADVERVARRLGAPLPAGRTLAREPELVVRFVNRLPASGRVHYLGAGDAGFTDDAFVLLGGGGRGGARAVAQVPFARLGAGCEIVCERGLPGGVPLLLPIVNLTALGRGWAPLHASAFTYRGAGALAGGWARGGKTATLLAFMTRGASYVGDDWVYVRGDGAEVRGLPEPLEVRDAYLDQLPELRARVEGGMGGASRVRARTLKLLQRAERVVPNGAGGDGGLRGRVRGALAWRLAARVPPAALFGADACPYAGPLHTVLLTLAHDGPDVRVRPADAGDVARRLALCLEHEWRELLSYYVRFRFAFPEARSELVEDRERRQGEALAGALAGKRAYVVSHPSPAPVAALFDALEPLVTR